MAPGATPTAAPPPSPLPDAVACLQLLGGAGLVLCALALCVGKHGRADGGGGCRLAVGHRPSPSCPPVDQKPFAPMQRPCHPCKKAPYYIPPPPRRQMKDALTLYGARVTYPHIHGFDGSSDARAHPAGCPVTQLTPDAVPCPQFGACDPAAPPGFRTMAMDEPVCNALVTGGPCDLAVVRAMAEAAARTYAAEATGGPCDAPCDERKDELAWTCDPRAVASLFPKRTKMVERGYGAVAGAGGPRDDAENVARDSSAADGLCDDRAAPCEGESVREAEDGVCDATAGPCDASDAQYERKTRRETEEGDRYAKAIGGPYDDRRAPRERKTLRETEDDVCDETGGPRDAREAQFERKTRRETEEGDRYAEGTGGSHDARRAPRESKNAREDEEESSVAAPYEGSRKRDTASGARKAKSSSRRRERARADGARRARERSAGPSRTPSDAVLVELPRFAAGKACPDTRIPPVHASASRCSTSSWRAFTKRCGYSVAKKYKN